MNELKMGAMSNQELAGWFQISEGYFNHHKEDKLEELKYFANFHLEGNKRKKVVIDEIINPVYSKMGSDNYRKVVEKIDENWSEDGLDSCSNVGNKVYECLVEEGNCSLAQSTVIKYTQKGRNELYGVPFVSGGKIGNCIYVWCKRDKETGEYSKLNDKEIEIKEKLQKKYFGDATEKQILVKGMVEAGEISQEEAWRVLEQLTNMNTNNFMCFLKELQSRLGCQVVRGTLVTRNNEKVIEIEDRESAF